jgi:hypothetical protein
MLWKFGGISDSLGRWSDYRESAPVESPYGAGVSRRGFEFFRRAGMPMKSELHSNRHTFVMKCEYVASVLLF